MRHSHRRNHREVRVDHRGLALISCMSNEVEDGC
jgi:hypothetical protein